MDGCELTSVGNDHVSKLNYTFTELGPDTKMTMTVLSMDKQGKVSGEHAIEITLKVKERMVFKPGNPNGRFGSSELDLSTSYILNGFAKLRGEVWVDIKSNVSTRRFKLDRLYPYDYLMDDSEIEEAS